MWGVIGGSGFEQFESVEMLEHLPRETPFGIASSGFRRIRIDDRECLFLPRHGQHHELLPSEINAAANIFALKQAGVTMIASLSSVGILHPGIEPKEVVIPRQYLNNTRGRDPITFCGDGVVGHVALGEPVWEEGSDYAASLELEVPVHANKTYVCIEGPTFSTRAESLLYQKMGADVVGMTAFPEYALAAEAGLAYLPCCFCTDRDSWAHAEEPVTAREILARLQDNNRTALTLLTLLLASPLEAPEAILEGNLANSLFSKPENHSSAQREWLDVLQHSPLLATT